MKNRQGQEIKTRDIYLNRDFDEVTIAFGEFPEDPTNEELLWDERIFFWADEKDFDLSTTELRKLILREVA